jgi:signal peptidase I
MFNLILTLLTAVTGLVWLLDKLFLARARAARGEELKQNSATEFCTSLFPVILAVFVVRSFLFEPFRIPSGSMIPTLHIGDFILVNKFGYGLRCPVGDCKFINIGEPKRGDVVVFRYPAQSKDDPNYGNDFIKRVIGVPGDHIVYTDHVMTVNGEKISTTIDGVDANDGFTRRSIENLTGVEHAILTRPDIPGKDADVIVPEGHYFMMGDNRDGSNDSRYWGFVPEANLKGRAVVIWMSWGEHFKPEFSRFGTVIH